MENGERKKSQRIAEKNGVCARRARASKRAREKNWKSRKKNCCRWHGLVDGLSVCVQREQHQRAPGAAVAGAVAAVATDAGVWHCAHFSVAAMGR